MSKLTNSYLGVVALLAGLTGWTLSFFAIVSKIKSRNRRLLSKKYGPADIMLWEKDLESGQNRRRVAQLTFRSHGDTEKQWTSGTGMFNHLDFAHRKESER